MVRHGLFLLAFAATACTVDAEFSGTTTEEFIRSLLPSQLSFKSNSDDSAAPNQCSDVISIELLSSSNDVVEATEDLEIQLTTSGSGSFYSDSSCTIQISSVDVSKGNSEAQFYYQESSVGSFSLNANASEMSSASLDFDVANPGAPFKLQISNISDTYAGDIINGTGITIDVLDVNDTIVPTATNSITLSLYSSPSTTPPAPSPFLYGTVTASASAGSVTFATNYLEAAGSGYVIRASDSSLPQPDIDSDSFTILPADPAMIAFSTQPPASTSADSSWGTVVSVRDGYGNLATDVSEQIFLNFQNNPGGATLAGTSSVSVSGGWATFSGLSIRTAATPYRLQANGFGTELGPLTPAISSDIQIYEGAAAQVAFIGNPNPVSSISAGSNFPTFTAEVQDQWGNRITGATDSIIVNAYTDSGCASGSTGTTNGKSEVAVAGTSTFASFNHEKAETIYLKAESGSYTGHCYSTASTTVDPDTPSTMSWDAPFPTTGIAGLDLPQNPTISLYDAYNNHVIWATNTLNLTMWTDSSCGVTQVPGVNINVGASGGTASFSGVSHNTAETIYLRVVDSLAQASTVCSNPIVISAGTATQIGFKSGTLPVSPILAGSTFTPVVQVLDTYGNVVQSGSYTVTLSAYTGAAGSCSTPSTGNFNAADQPTVSGEATFSANHEKAETIHLRAVTGGFSVCSSVDIVVNPATATVLQIAGPTTGDTIDCHPFVVSTEDTFGNASNVSTSTTINLGSTSGTSLFYPDINCSTTPMTTVDVAIATNSSTFYYHDPTASSSTVSVSNASFTGDSQTITLSNPIVTVQPVYSGFPYWNDYINYDDTRKPWKQTAVTACDTTSIGTPNRCVHTGPLLYVELTGITGGCVSWSLNQQINWLNWTCDDTGTYTRFYSTGVKPEIALDNLINSAGNGWDQNKVTLTDGTYVYESVLGTWWTNPVQTAPDSSSAAVTLNSSRTIYTIQGPGIIQSQGYLINNNKIGFVVRSNAILKLRDSSARNCQASTGTYNSLGRTCLLAAGSSSGSLDHIWIEGAFDGDASGINTSTESNALLMANVRYSKFKGIRIQNSHNQGVMLTSLSSNFWDGLIIANSGTRGTGINNFGLYMLNSSYNVFTDVRSYNNMLDGIGIFSSANNTFKNTIVAANDRNGIAINQGSSKNKIINLSAINNGQIGIDLDAPGTGQTFQNTLSANNKNIGVRTVHGSISTSANTYVNTAILHNGNSTAGETGIRLTNSNYNRFVGSFINNNNFPVGGGNCISENASSSGLYDVTCLNAGAWPSISPVPNNSDATYNDNSSLSLSGSFWGKATSELVNTHTTGQSTYSSLTDFLFFQNRYRLWGTDSISSFPASDQHGRCSSGTCQIWDWRLSSSQSVIRDRTFDGTNPNPPFGATCPSIMLSGSIAARNLTAGLTYDETFMKYAVEVVGDYIGDDDGLCESNEECHYTPNFGAYQGSGINFGGACAFTGGTITGLRIYSSGVNGY